jgi:hypothetical protein
VCLVPPLELLDGLRDANFHAGGIRCLRLLRLDARYFGELGAESRCYVTVSAPPTCEHANT